MTKADYLAVAKKLVGRSGWDSVGGKDRKTLTFRGISFSVMREWNGSIVCGARVDGVRIIVHRFRVRPVSAERMAAALKQLVGKLEGARAIAALRSLKCDGDAEDEPRRFTTVPAIGSNDVVEFNRKQVTHGSPRTGTP